LRRIKKRSTLDEINKDIIVISSLFMTFVIIGSLINKFFPQYIDLVQEKIIYTASYYNSNIDLKEVLMSNFKMDLVLLLVMSIGSATIILSPIALIVFALKGMSIGYTINSFIIAMKLSSFKIVLITLIKFMVVLPGMLILALISFRYLVKVIDEVKKQNKLNYIYLIKRYLMNSAIIIMLTISVQTILNTISIVTLKIF
jgi:stage II sporulation protein M